METSTLIRDGVHFGLPEMPYHEDPALGSSDIGRLERGASAYWWGSSMNPHRPPIDKTTPDKEVGKAMHKIILEGAQAFTGTYTRRPDDREGATSADKSALTKSSNALAERNGLKLLHGDAYDRVVLAGGDIAANPELRDAFAGGMPEVSIFWTKMVEGVPVRCKCRIDYLKVLGMGDLKSVANEYELPFEEACLRHIRIHRYPRQATHYFDGRSELPRLVAEGCVYGDHDPAWLRRVAAQRVCGWQWVFWQKKNAPEVYSRTLTFRDGQGNYNALIVDEERRRINLALERYVIALRTFGTARPWTSRIAVSELAAEDLGHAYL